MRFLNIATPEARRVLVKMLRDMIARAENGRLEQCTIVYTLRDQKARETFVSHFAPNNWRAYVARMLLAAAGQLLGGSIELVREAREVGDKSPGDVVQETVH